MDSLKLLTRSTNLNVRRKQNIAQAQHIPSQGIADNTQRFQENDEAWANNSRKRKRDGVVDPVEGDAFGPLNFFSKDAQTGHASAKPVPSLRKTTDDGENEEIESLSLEERQKILKSHKIKITNLSALSESVAQIPVKKSKKSKAKPPPSRKKSKEAARLYPQPVRSFSQLGASYGVSRTLLRNIDEQGYYVPTEVQLAALPLLLGGLPGESDGQPKEARTVDILTVAPTGSGKTLAFLVPLIHQIQRERTQERHVSAVILAPTKELVTQIVNEGRRLSTKTGVRITAMRKGMVLDASGRQENGDLADEDESGDEERADEDGDEGDSQSKKSIVKSDIIVSTPPLLSSSIGDRSLETIRHLVLDEADVLLDPMFRDQTMSVWNACTSSDLRASFWSATIGSSIEDLVKQTLIARANTLSLPASAIAPLLRLIIGLKDTSLPNITHRLIYAATEPGKLLGVRQLLRPTNTGGTSKTPSQPILRPPFLVFTQTPQRAQALYSELLYDIPTAAGGSSRLACLTAHLSDTARSDIMTRFRKGQIWVLITTDLLSRGIDFRGVNGVVNYDIPGTSAGYIHRAGRTGRQGREGGVCVTFYTKEDIGYVKQIANVIAASEKLRGVSGDAAGTGDGQGIQKWLLDALPDVSKRDRQMLKRRGGIEARRSRPATTATAAAEGNEEEEDEARKRERRRARISTKSSFERRVERRRREAVEGSRRRKGKGKGEDGLENGDGGEEEGEWEGFD